MEDDGSISKEHIKEAMKWEQWNIWAKWYELHSTHPLISKRLLAISARSKEFNQEPYITFDLVKEESYVDDFLKELLISFLPTISFIIGVIAFFASVVFEYNVLLVIGVSFLVTMIFSYIKFKKRFPTNNFEFTNVRELLGKVKVSHITAIPCSLEGTIIGRGNPGCIFNEDFVIKDKTGIIFLDYNQPLVIINKIFALFKSKDYFDKNIKITGWYRRSPVPYVELKTMEVDGKVKKIYTYRLDFILRILGMILAILLIIASFAI